MNILFLCGVIESIPGFKKGEELKTIEAVLLVPDAHGEKIFKVPLVSRNEAVIKKMSKLKRYDLIFISGTVTENALLVDSVSQIGRYQNKEGAFKRLYEISPINQGLLAGELISYNKDLNEAIVSIKRDADHFYGSLKEEDILHVRTRKTIRAGDKYISLPIRLDDGVLVSDR